MKRTANDAPPESDRFADTPHPRETFDLFGHAAVEVQLLDAWRAGRLPQSIILGGPEGIGKATLAWRLARFLLAHPDPASPEVAAAENLFVAPTDPSARRIEALAHSDVFLLRREWNSERKRMRTEIRVD
ncbi:MAG: DNA polymerase III subunit delta', partial [Beijerinckiaceae bacterium]